MMLVLASFFVVIALSPAVAATVTAGVTDEIVYSTYIRDDSTAIPFFGFGAESDTTTDRLIDIEIWFDTNGGMSTGELKSLSNNASRSGVAIVRDDGDTDDVFDEKDTPVDTSDIDWFSIAQYSWVQMDFDGAAAEYVPDDLDGIYQWFVVIRTDIDIDDNDQIRARIYSNDIDFSGGVSQPSSTEYAPTVNVRETRYYDVGDGNMMANDAEEQLGLRILDGGPYEKFDSVTIYMPSGGGFTQSDLATITTDAGTSGIAIYRNNGNSVWGTGDVEIDCTSVDTSNWPYVTLYPDDEDLPNSPINNYAYWIVIRTSGTISHQNAFYTWGMEDDILINGTLDHDFDRLVDTPENNNDEYEFCQADTQAPRLNSYYWSEGSSYIHQTGGMSGTLWFSNTATWQQTATLVANSVSDSWTGVEYVDFSYEASLDSGGYRDTTPTYSYTYRFDSWDTDASAPITLTMRDRAGNVDTYDVNYAMDVTPPAVTIVEPVDLDTVSGTVAIKASATDAQSGIRYSSAMVSWDGMSWYQMPWDGTHFTYNWDTTVLPDGNRRVIVQMRDEVNNLGSARSNVVLDNTGPTSYIYWPTAGQYMHSVNDLMVVAVAADASPIASMEARLGAGLWTAMTWNAVNGTWEANMGAPGAGTLNIQVRATDTEGNLGAVASVVAFGDANDPTVTVVSHGEGDEVGKTITIRVDASDTEQLTAVKVFVSGTTTMLLDAVYNPATGYYEVTIDTTTLSDGKWAVAGVAFDEAGRYTVTTPFNITVDNTEPTLAILTPTTGTYVYGTYTITASAADTGSGFDSSGCALTIDGGEWQTMTLSGGIWSYDLDTTALTDGMHTIVVGAIDDAGNIAVRTVSFYVDNSPPIVAVVTPSTNDYVETTYTFAISAIDNLGVASVSALFTGPTTSMNVTFGYNAASGYWEWTTDTTNWEEGTWTIQPFAFEMSGRLYTGASAITFTVDNNAPWIAITAPTDGEVILSDTYDITVQATDGPFTIPAVIYRVDSGNWVAMTAGTGNDWTHTWDTSAVVDGEHILTFAAIDAAGHLAIEDVTVTVDNTDPTCMVVIPSEEENIEGIVTFGIQAADSLGVESVDITFTGVSGVGTVAATYNPSSGYWEYVLDTTTVTDADGSLVATAKDTSGRTTVSTSVSFRIDNNAPSLVVASPMDGEIILNATYAVMVTADDTVFGLMPGDVKWRVDSNPWADMNSGTGGWSAGWFTTNYADGAHTLSFMVTDAVGHVTEASIDVVVDNTDPVASLNTPSVDEYVNGVYTFSARAADSLGVRSVEMHFGFSDSSWLDDSMSTYNPSTGYWELTVDTSTLPDGPAAMSLTVIDNSGRMITSMVYDFAVDNNDPALLLLSPMPGAIALDGMLEVLINASDEGFTLGDGNVEYNLDATGWLAMTNLSGEPTLWGFDLNTSAMPDGEHTLVFRVTDFAGHVTSTFVDFVVDNTDPTCSVMSPSQGEFVMGTYVFRVSATDALGVAMVHLTFEGIPSLTGADANYNPSMGLWEFMIDTSTLYDAEASVSAVATDASGRVSAIAGPVDFILDNNAPVISFVDPVEGQIITVGEITVTVSAVDDFFDLEFGDVFLSIDDGSWMPMDTDDDGNFVYDWNTSGLSDGEHNLKTKAEDAAGYTAEVAINVIVDNHLPALAIVSPTDGQFVTGMINFQVSSSDVRDIVRVVLEWDEGMPVFATINTATNYYEHSLDTTTLVDGTYVLTATSVDGSGLVSEASVEFHVDNTEPELVFTGPLNGAVLDGEVEVTAEASDTFIDTLQFSVDGVGWVDMEDGNGTFDSNLFSDGVHTITVRAIDGSGKATDASSEVTIDNMAPLLSVADFPEMGEHLAGARMFSVFSSDAVGVVAVTVTIGDESWPVYLNPQTDFYEWTLVTTAFEDGDLELMFTSFDAAGHETPLTWDVYVDNTAPLVVSQSPRDGASVQGIVRFEAEVTDDTGVQLVQVSIDEGPWMSMDRQEDGSYLYKWETTSDDDAEDLAYSLRVTDTLGNTEETGYGITVDNPTNMAFVALLIILVVLVLLGVFFMKQREKKEAEGPEDDEDLVELEDITTDYNALAGLEMSAEAPAGENGMPTTEELVAEVEVELEEKTI